MDPLPSTHLDSALQILALDDPKQWSPVRLWLDFLKIFLSFTPEWSSVASAADSSREHLRDLPRSIRAEFDNAEQDIEDAVKKGETAKLDVLRSRLLEKMEQYKPKVADAYKFLSGYVFDKNTLSHVVLGDQQWFPSFSSLLGNCQCLNLHSASFLSNCPLYDELESVLKSLEKLQLRQIMFRDSEQFRDMCIEHGGVAICLAGLLFSCWAENTTFAKVKLWDLVLKIKPTTPGLVAQYLEAIKSQIHSLQEELLVELVGIALLAPNGSLELKQRPETDSLVFLIRHLVDSPGTDNGEMGRILCDAASDPDSLGRLLQEAELLRTKMLLTELGDRESICERPRFDDAYSENMMQILEEMETLLICGAGAEASKMGGSGPDPYVKVSLDFYIAVFQAFLMELMTRSSLQILVVKVQVQKLSKESKRFRRFSLILPLKNPVDMELISTLMVVATGKAETLHEFFQSTHAVEENMSDLSRLLSEFLEQLTVLNGKMEEIYIQFQDSFKVSFPKTLPGLSFVEAFLERLSGMADRAFPDGYCVVSQIEAVLEGENSLAEVLKKVEENENEISELTKLKRRVTQAAYEADYVIDSILVLDADKCHLLWLSDAVSEMNLVKADLMKFCGEKKHLLHVQGTVKTLDADESAQSHDTPEVGEYIVPLDVQVSDVSDLLTKGESDGKYIVGIVGTPGVGKTTLARMVYDHPHVRNHFQKHAWCTISQGFRMRDVFVKILRDIDSRSIENLQESDDETALRKKLKDELQGKSYLIVMDDMWSDEAWTSLKRGMPESPNGGRILFTSRMEKVLSSYNDNVVVYSQQPLSPIESWNLLQRRVFGENLKCPEGLRDVGFEIARSCKGLPLAVVAVSGVLRKKEPEPHVWDEIRQHLSSSILQSPESQCNRILKLSYSHLPDYLKSCLLYFAAFREDQEIQVNRLIRLWISEGLVRQVHPKPKPKSNKVVGGDNQGYVSTVRKRDADDGTEDKVKALEDVALDYVDDLTSRSLIIADRRSGSTKKVKVCKIHDLLHNLCLAKAKEDNFFESINNYSKLYPRNTEDHGLDLNPINDTPPKYTNKHRLRIFSKRNQFVKLQPSGEPVRTLLFSAAPDARPTCPYDVSFIPRNFKILTVLDIESINMDSSFPEKILDLDPLRYLAVGGDIVSIPTKIERLRNLEDFTVRGLKSKVELPSTIWTMSKLRHLHVYPGLILDFGDEKYDSCQLHNLRTLSSPALSKWEDLEAIIKKAPQLRKLKCTFSPILHSMDCSKFKYPEELLKLESLKVLYTGQSSEPWKLGFPSRLIKLSLKGFRLTFDCISSIGELRKLQVLTLVSVSFDDSVWEMGDDEFPELKTLKLDSLEVQDWIVPSSNFEKLERLVMSNCKHLQQVPSSFSMNDSLEEIELMQCSAITKTSLAGYVEERVDYRGTEKLTITVNGIKIFP